MSLFEAREAYYGTAVRERRPVTGAQVRADAEGGPTFSGYASVTNTPYTVSDFLGDYTETIQRGAFAKSLAEQDDVRLLVNHDGMPIARTKSGTLVLSEDDHGLLSEADNLDTANPLVQQVQSAMARGDMDQMSFAFQATRQEWNEDYTVRTILEVKLFDVSLVTYPASPSTSAYLRADGLDELRGMVREGRSLSGVEARRVRDALDWLSALEATPEGRQARAEQDQRAAAAEAVAEQARQADLDDWLRIAADSARSRAA